MPFERPTLKALITRAEGDIKSELSLTFIIRRTFFSAIAKMAAGLAHMLHGHLVFISRQIFPDQAVDEFLERWGSILKVEKKPATFAQLTATGTGVDSSIIAAGKIFQRTDGTQYVVDTEVTIAAGVYTVALTCLTNSSTGNMANGDGLSLASPISGVDTDIVIASTVLEADDAETQPLFRGRVLDRFAEPPGGGNANDYVTEAQKVSGVTRSWVFPGHLGEGTVGISFVEDAEDPIIPSTPKVQEVQGQVDQFGPVSATKIVFAPIAKPTNFNIKLLPNTQAVRDAIVAEIKGLYTRESQVGGALKNLNESFTGTIKISKIREAISTAAGEDDHDLVQPNSNQTASIGVIRTVGTFTFSTLVA